MAATELSPPGSNRRCRLPPGLAKTWLYTYASVWAATLIPAIVIAPARGTLGPSIRNVLKATLSAEHNPPPTAGHVLVLAAHNIPITAWPLLLGPFGAHRSRFQAHVADGLLLAWITVNTLQVGAALDAYGSALLPYLPHLPIEWAGFALGMCGWVAQRREPLSVREGLGLFALIAGVTVCSAVVETVAVPHR
jgi:hypothetical protein